MRRTVLLASVATAVLLISGVVLATAIGSMRSGNTTAERPNFVLVVTDDLTKQDYLDLDSALGSFTSEGTFFENAFVTTALCCPSRASTLTGLYAHNHHITQHINPGTGYKQYHAKGYDQKDLAVWLRDACYKTGLVGKYMNKYDAQGDGVPAGWTDWYGADSPIKRWRLNENGSIKPTRRTRLRRVTSTGRTCLETRLPSSSGKPTPQAAPSFSGTVPTPRTLLSLSPRKTRVGWGPGQRTTRPASMSMMSQTSRNG
jgi:N-acetylglucosamine-6-sulfatase